MGAVAIMATNSQFIQKLPATNQPCGVFNIAWRIKTLIGCFSRSMLFPWLPLLSVPNLQANYHEIDRTADNLAAEKFENSLKELISEVFSLLCLRYCRDQDFYQRWIVVVK